MRLALAGLALRIVVVAMAIAALGRPGQCHDIYTGVTGFDSRLCCGADDCRPVEFKIRPYSVDFLVEDKWIRIPEDQITYARIPGDDGVKGHFCGRKLTPAEAGEFGEHVYGGWFVFCAFVPPGGF